MDESVIRRPLNGDAVAAFTAGVYAEAYTAGAVDRLFASAGAARHVSVAADGSPGELAVGLRVPKSPFTDDTAWLSGDAVRATRYCGERLAAGVLRQLCEALGGAREIAMPLRKAEDFTQAADAALASLAACGEAFLVLAGDWSGSFLDDPGSAPPDGYEPARALPDRDGGRELARYRGRPVVRFRDYGGDGVRRLYAVEPGAWGCLVRAPAGDGQELRVEAGTVSPRRAAEMLDERPDLLAGEPDEAARLRKLRASVEITVVQRAGFRVRDPSRACCVRASA